VNWKVKDLQTSRGEKVIENFILQQEKNSQLKITRMILLLEKYGPYLGMPYSKKIHKKLWELRITGKKTIRVIYAVRKNEIILLHIFIKKSQKMPKKEIDLAIKRFAKI
jgi:phage-related protein